jgi:hypothetical protein
MKWFRTLGAVGVGLFVALLVVALCETGGHVLFPLPAGIDPQDLEQIRQAMNEGKIPTGALFSVLLGWVLGVFCGSWVAAKLTNWGKMACGFVVGAFIFSCSILMLLTIPHPIMFALSAILLVPLASYFGTMHGSAGAMPTPSPDSPPSST